MRRPTEDPCARPAIATLERLHMELGGKLLEKPPDQESGQQMLHIEAVIKMLDRRSNLARITVKRRKANGWFKRGTLFRKALDVLRGGRAEPTIVVREPNMATQLAPQNNQLKSQRRILCFKPSLRPERQGQDCQNKTE
jgi:hypothetical protein